MFTFFNGCGIPPVTLTCPQGGHAQAQTMQGCTPPIVGPTGTQGCTQPPHCYGPTGTYGCTTPPNCLIGPTGYQGCHQGSGQAQNVGITGWYGCHLLGPTGTQGCLTPTGTPPATVCPQPTGTAQAQNLGPTGTQGCTQPGHCVGQTGYLGCHQGTAQAQTVVNTIFCYTKIGCPPPLAQAQNVGPTGTQGCTQPGHCVGQTGWQGCHQQGTMATVCTQYGCDGGNAQAQTLGHTAYEGCGQHGTMATVCTQVQCGPTHLLGCTGYEGCHQQVGTAATVCTEIGCDGGGNAQAQVHSIPVVNCIPTRSCTGIWPAC